MDNSLLRRPKVLNLQLQALPAHVRVFIQLEGDIDQSRRDFALAVAECNGIQLRRTVSDQHFQMLLLENPRLTDQPNATRAPYRRRVAEPERAHTVEPFQQAIVRFPKVNPCVYFLNGSQINTFKSLGRNLIELLPECLDIRNTNIQTPPPSHDRRNGSRGPNTPPVAPRY